MKIDSHFVRTIEFDNDDDDNELNSTVDNQLENQSQNGKCLKSVSILQKFDSDEAGVVWDASLFLAKYLEHQCRCLRNIQLSDRNVIELGAGTGFLGIWCAALGANVLMTDLETNLDLIRMNVEKNQLIDARQLIKVEAFDWQDEDKYQWNFLNWKPLNQIDYVLISDCVYYEKGMLALYKFIEWFFDEILKNSKQTSTNNNNKHVQMFITYEDREDKTDICNQFINKIKQNVHLRMDFISDHMQLHPDYQSDDLHLLRISLNIDGA